MLYSYMIWTSTFGNMPTYTIGLPVAAGLLVAYTGVSCLPCVSLCSVYMSLNPSDTQWDKSSLGGFF